MSFIEDNQHYFVAACLVILLILWYNTCTKSGFISYNQNLSNGFNSVLTGANQAPNDLEGKTSGNFYNQVKRSGFSIGGMEPYVFTSESVDPHSLESDSARALGDMRMQIQNEVLDNETSGFASRRSKRTEPFMNKLDSALHGM